MALTRQAQQLQRQGFRRQMMQQVQQQISKLEQEFYSHNVASKHRLSYFWHY